MRSLRWHAGSWGASRLCRSRDACSTPTSPTGTVDSLDVTVSLPVGCGDRARGVLGDQVRVDRRAGVSARGGRAHHLGAQVGDVAGHPHARHRGRPRRVRRHGVPTRRPISCSTASSPSEASTVRRARRSAARRPRAPRGTTSPRRQPHAGEPPSVGSPRPTTSPGDHRGCPERGQLLAPRRRSGPARCAGRGRRRRVHCRNSSAWCTAIGAGGQHADRLVAHLPAVAVRAVQDVAAPALRAGPGTSGSSSTRPVATSSRRARTGRPVGQRHDEPVVRRARRPRPGRDAPRRRTPPARPARAPAGRAGGDALLAQQAVHPVGRARCAGCPVVDHQHRPPRPRQRHRPAQPRGTATDHHHISHAASIGPPPTPIGKHPCRSGKLRPMDDIDQLMRTVGPRLRAVRQQRGLTLAQASDGTGISVSTLSRLESGTRRPQPGAAGPAGRPVPRAARRAGRRARDRATRASTRARSPSTARPSSRCPGGPAACSSTSWSCRPARRRPTRS